MCCTDSPPAQMLACQVVEISSCVPMQTLVMMWPLLLCVGLLTYSEVQSVYVLTGARYVWTAM